MGEMGTDEAGMDKTGRYCYAIVLADAQYHSQTVHDTGGQAPDLP